MWRQLEPDWKAGTEVHPIVKPGALFLHAMPNYIDTLPSLPVGFGTLVKINFIISDQAPAGTIIPVEFQNDPYWQLYWGHYNAYTEDDEPYPANHRIRTDFRFHRGAPRRCQQRWRD